MNSAFTKPLILLPVATSLFLLGACTSTRIQNAEPLPELTFAHMPAIPVNVKRIDYSDITQHGATTWDMSNDLVTPPNLAMRRYLSKRFKADGSDGVLTIFLKQAQIVSSDQPNANKILSYIPLADTTEYKTEIVVDIESSYMTGRPNATTSTRFVRKTQMPLNVTLAYREAKLQRTLEEMMRDIDTSLISTLSNEFNIVSPEHVPQKHMDVTTKIPENETKVGVFFSDVSDSAKRAGTYVNDNVSGGDNGDGVAAPQPLAPVTAEPLND